MDKSTHLQASDMRSCEDRELMFSSKLPLQTLELDSNVSKPAQTDAFITHSF
jgi:hypothetical protein